MFKISAEIILSIKSIKILHILKCYNLMTKLKIKIIQYKIVEVI